MATGENGRQIAKEGRKGDQLFVEGIILRDYRIRKPGQGRDDFAFLVLGYRFGAKRRPPGATGARVTDVPPPIDPQRPEGAIAVALETDGL